MAFPFQPVVYVQISPELLSVKNVKTGAVIAEVPEMAISAPPQPVMLGVGAQARAAAAATPGARVVNPFAHPRTLVGDFTVAEQLIRAFIRKLDAKAWFAPSPRVVIHPLGAPAGGYTQIERRAVREMALGAGASEVIVYTGRKLTDQEVLNRQFPADGEWE